LGFPPDFNCLVDSPSTIEEFSQLIEREKIGRS